MKVSVGGAFTRKDYEAEKLSGCKDYNEMYILLKIVSGHTAFFKNANQSFKFWLKSREYEV